MGKTSTERQRKFMARHAKAGTAVRLSINVRPHAVAALRRLAQHSERSQREILERLLIDAEDAAIQTIDPAMRRTLYFRD